MGDDGGRVGRGLGVVRLVQDGGGGEEGEEAGEAERGEGVSAEGGIMSRFKYG